ncbi:MAG: hypothetical protein R3D30_14620 [Hyphomicrobiales bacterium]
MRRLLAVPLALTFLTAPNVADARFDDHDATRLCKREAADEFGADDFRGLVVSKKKHDRYKVTGVAERRGSADITFVCEVKDRRVTDIERTGRAKDDHGGSGTKKAIAAGALGALLGAVIVGAASNKHKHDDHGESNWDRDRRDNDRGVYSPDPGVICHDFTEMCYVDGKYDPRTTRREYR